MLYVFILNKRVASMVKPFSLIYNCPMICSYSPNIKCKRHAQRGNVLFYILIAIALFAALSYAVSQMMRSGDVNMVSEQTAKLYASDILSYARSVQKAVRGLRIDGCDETDISFANSTLSGYAHTPAVDDSCKVFDSDGGGMTYIAPASDWLDSTESARDLYGEYYFPAEGCVDLVGSSTEDCHTSGDDTGELMMVLPWLSLATCQQINSELGYGTSIDVNTSDCWEYGTNGKFTGTYSEDKRWGNASNDGRPAQCVQCTGDPNSGYHFYQVLIAR